MQKKCEWVVFNFGICKVTFVKVCLNNFLGVEEGKYKMIGQIFALSMVHGGPLPNFLSRLMVENIVQHSDHNVPFRREGRAFA